MAHTIDNFISNFRGGYRLNHFIVSMTPAAAAGAVGVGALTYHARATSLPASTVTVLNVPYRGRVFKAPGVRTYNTWQLTVLNDKSGENSDLYQIFHKWSNALNDHDANTTTGTNADSEANNLLGTFTVEMLDYNGISVPNRKWTLKYAWPANVGQVALDMENNDNPISTFIVDIEFSLMEYGVSI
jgi:hypothetical protein